MTLNSDELGKKGESRFSEICSDARLTCNPSTHDRTGWDFVVEFSYDPPGSPTASRAAAENLSGRLEQLAEWRVSSPSISYQGEITC
jgi:hypothetical protein